MNPTTISIPTTAHTRRNRKALLALVAVIGGSMLACGGDSTPTAAGASLTTTTGASPTSTTLSTSAVPTTAAPVTSTSAPATAASTTTTTAGSGAACPTSPVPAGATDITNAPGSFDGDGQADVLMTYRSAGTWYLRAQLSSGGNVDVAVPNVGSADVVKAIGGFNIDAGLADEAFATVGSGAYAAHVAIWKAGGFCQLTRLTVNGQPSVFPVGASVMNQVGLKCISGTALQVLEAQSNNTGTQYTGTIANYDVVGNTLVLANTSPAQLMAPADPNLPPYSKLTCGSLTLP